VLAHDSLALKSAPHPTSNLNFGNKFALVLFDSQQLSIEGHPVISWTMASVHQAIISFAPHLLIKGKRLRCLIFTYWPFNQGLISQAKWGRGNYNRRDSNLGVLVHS